MRLQWIAAAFLSMTAFAVGQTQNLTELRAKASAGDAESQFLLGLDYANGIGVEKDENLAVKWYRAAAEQGNLKAQNDLGVCYNTGRGVEKDKVTATTWWRKAAAKGYGPARFNLGTAYFNGDGVGVNDGLAYAWFVLARDAGDQSAREAVQRMESEHSATWIVFGQFKVAEMLEHGDGVATDEQAAKTIYEALTTAKIPEQSLKADAHIRLAQMYLDGRGAPRSIPNAYEHCESAAKLNSYFGYSCMGVLQENGQLGQLDYKQAAKFYEKAIALGDYLSMVRLGRLYENGLGVRRDDVAALTLYLVGEGRLKSVNPRRSDVLMAKMKPGDVQKATKKAAEWHPWMKLP